jgi:putative ABC transport system permease protein
MLLNTLKIALRSLRKHRLYAALNIGGLAIGVACSLAIGLWVSDELAFDRWLPNRERVFRLESHLRTPDGTLMNLPAVGWPIGTILKADYPEVEQLTHLKSWSPQLRHRGVYVKEQALMADEAFFGVLGYDLAEGNPKTALNEPFSVILSSEAEAKYFGAGQGMGKVLMVSDTLPHRVTGILRHVPRQSHLQFTMVRSLASLGALYPQDMAYEYESGWFDVNVANYVLLKPGTDAAAFERKISGLVGQRGREAVRKTGMNSTLHLRPVADVYLHSGMPTIGNTIGNGRAISLFAAIGLFILLIAGLNVVNLSTARATTRAKEVGVKKALGGQRGQLVGQFLAEAAVVCSLAVGLGALAAWAALPLLNEFTGKSFGSGRLFSPTTALLCGLFLVLLVPLTGVYPALILSRFQPITVLKGAVVGSGSGFYLRRGLVVVQFVLSIGLIACTLVARQQVRFMGQQPLGFTPENVVLLSLDDIAPGRRVQVAHALRDGLRTHSSVVAASASYAVPGQEGWDGQFAYGEGNAPGKGILVEHIPVDAQYVQTLQLGIMAGRDFGSSKTDENTSFLINEMAVSAFGWGSPKAAIGKKLRVSGVNGQVVGVLKSYHQHGLQAAIRPVVLNVFAMPNVVAVRYRGNDATAVLAHIGTLWQKLAGGYTLKHSFLDESFRQQYRAEQQLIQAFSVAAGLAILIACLGLFGLATFMAEQRTKEIGIRKVLGASVASVVVLLSNDFLKLIVIAIFIASPLAWWGLQRWLQDFAYRVELTWWVFALAGTLAVGIALLTVGFQSIRAALMNPVKSLRSE